LAVCVEFAQLQKLGVFEVVDSLLNGRKAIESRIVFREKRDGYGNLIKFKARIVAKGFSQICQGWNFRKWRCRVIDKSTLWSGVMYYIREEYYLAIV